MRLGDMIYNFIVFYLLDYSAMCKMQCKVNFLKRITAGLNSEFSFLQMDCHTKVRQPSLPYIYP